MWMIRMNGVEKIREGKRVISYENDSDINLFERNFHHLDVAAILQIPLNNLDCADEPTWHWEKNGLFSVKSAKMIISRNHKSRQDIPEEIEVVVRRSWRGGSGAAAVALGGGGSAAFGI
ncbi:nudix hydrolase homolog 11 [Striga asiatica]|uniref:Nudix hydrolase homolog 11 n=1 Tax=Striga asiatica TaxID=4170 RepID=A0A5A7R026_STRAF|nr:nudix hydrolase homolog 11 [Striga asiatica]